ncbi:MAG: phage terminase large subunit [Alphaproteobacteria bacterium]|nr:phage terminase large subunit [Alphaproteobacteria bacterium]MBN2675269.1 phage terminase large subunit [Alphaproteobacteria bacterium]
MNKEVFNAFLRNDFKLFVMKVFNEVSAGVEYIDNWHIDVICDELMNMRDGKHYRSIINIPPRYLKSIICSVAWPAYLLGKDPTTNIICVSYSGELAEKFAHDCRNVMLADWYRELFPLTRLHKSRQSVNDFETTRGGGRQSTSIGGTLTGRGGDWIIIDDPLKPSDAMSDTQREKVNEWYASTLYSRLNDKKTGKIVLIMQRLHQDDLTGYLLETDAKFHHVKLPMVASEDEKWSFKNRITGKQNIVERNKGDLLHPDRDSMEVVKDLQDSLGEYGFTGQYQQEPCPLEGGIIKESWLQYYDVDKLSKIDLGKIVRIYISWDTACKTGENNAYSACCVVVMTIESNKYKFYLVAVYRGKFEMPDLLEETKGIYNKLAHTGHVGLPVKMLIEDKSSGTQLIQHLKIEKTNSGYDFDVEAIKPDGDKKFRLIGASVYIQRGDLLFPQSNKNVDEWWPDFKKELLSFPGGKYKDQVDALSQCITFANEEIKNFG